jgi:DNA-binding NarL/FixJ family response regulator
MNNQRLVDASDHYKLSQREREILVLLTKGLSNTFIAETLCISPNSVKTHVRHIYEKLDVHKRDEMVALIDAYSPDPSAQDI